MSFTQVSLGSAVIGAAMVAALDLVIPNPKPIALISVSYDVGADIVTYERIVTGPDIAAPYANFVYRAGGGPEVVQCRANGTGDFSREEQTE